MDKMSFPTRWCFAPGCMANIKIAKRHFFKFPKDRKRWLEWLKACDRMDLETIGPEYANRYYRLCHLHFRIEMFRNIEGKIFLNREAIPSIFLKSIQSDNIKSGDLLQPISFVTIFLKPESRSNFGNSSMNLVQSEVSQESSVIKSDEKNTLTIPTLQVLFPKASIKQTLENRGKSLGHVSLLDTKSENNNKNVSATKMQLMKDERMDSAVSILSKSPQGKEEFVDKILRLTNSNVSLPTTSSAIVSSTHSTPQNENRTPKRKHWHISTQTPEAWLYIDSLLKKRQTETCVENLAAKRRKTICTEEADQHLNAEQIKAACANLLPRDSALLFSACIDVHEKRKNRKSFDGHFALRLFFTAPIAYRLYRMLYPLPTVHQLKRSIRSWDMPPGLNDNTLNALRMKMKSLPPAERRCCLCVREMLLQPHLFYNLSRDRIVGFYEIGTKKRRILARRALVLMARSLAGDWEQPVAYYFHGGACNADVIMNLIFQAIIRLTHFGATVHVLVTGTAPTFLRMSQQLGISAERPWFLVNNEKIFYIFDVTRLMKATRNVLMTHDIHFGEKKASWTDIELFFKRDSQMRLPLAPKLLVTHLKPECRKTETKYAVEVFSDRVAAGLCARIASGEFPLRAIGTMEFVHNFDQLFGILNSSASTGRSNRFGQAFTGSMHEMWFLEQTRDFLKSIRVVDENGTHVKSIKCFDRWQITINAITQLWDALKTHGFTSLRTRRLNQESIERVFRSIRQQSRNRVKPTPIMFTRAFKNLVSKHLFEHVSKIDSVEKAQKMLKRIALAPARQIDGDPPAAVVQTALDIPVTNYRDIDLRLPEKSAFKRVCEFLLAECLHAHDNCDVCVAYAAKEDSNLFSGKDSFNLYISGLEDTFMRIFEQLSVEENIGARMLQHAQQIDYKPPCPNFPVAFLVKLFLRMRIYFTLSRHNRICRDVDSRDYLKVTQL